MHHDTDADTGETTANSADEHAPEHGRTARGGGA